MGFTSRYLINRYEECQLGGGGGVIFCLFVCFNLFEMWDNFHGLKLKGFRNDQWSVKFHFLL